MNLWLSWHDKTWRLAILLATSAFFVGARPASVSAAVEYNEMIPLHDDFDGCSGERILINGVQLADLTGVDNDTRHINSILLGAVAGIDTSTRGTYYFDAFESRRQSYIGP